MATDGCWLCLQRALDHEAVDAGLAEVLYTRPTGSSALSLSVYQRLLMDVMCIVLFYIDMIRAWEWRWREVNPDGTTP